jgi:hypothetical protein
MIRPDSYPHLQLNGVCDQTCDELLVFLQGELHNDGTHFAADQAKLADQARFYTGVPHNRFHPCTSDPPADSEVPPTVECRIALVRYHDGPVSGPHVRSKVQPVPADLPAPDSGSE